MTPASPGETAPTGGDSTLPGRGESLWLATTPASDYPELTPGIHVDVAVLGGGMVGLTAAYLLKREGAKVAVVEAAGVATGVSANTTAKLSSLHGLSYQRVESNFGADGARAYGAANEAGIARVAAIAEREGIDCDLRRKAAYTYAESADDLERIRTEVDAAARAGLPASFADQVPLPFPVAGAARFSDQAEFHPRKYLLALAERIPGDGCHVFERTRATGVDDGDRPRIDTTAGPLTADHVIVATHMPFLDRGLFFARTHPERSYAMALRIRGEAPDGMFLSTESPAHSIRAHPVDEGELLIVGGESHKTGQDGPTEPRYRRLEAYARERFDVESVEYRWSAQDNMPLDGVPYVGKVNALAKRVYVATGFKKWGLAAGAEAAAMLADRVAGRENEWASTFDSTRLKPLASAKEFVVENANVAKRLVGDRLGHGGDELADLAPGEGRIVRTGAGKVAAYRDDAGQVVAVSPVCTHLGCHVSWNGAERSWDCPCHGSRFDTHGNVLQGPAVTPLERRSLD